MGISLKKIVKLLLKSSLTFVLVAEFIEMTTGKVLLLYNGFTFWKTNHCGTTSGNIRWYCSSRTKEKCLVSILCRNDQILEIKSQHNHPAPILACDTKGRFYKVFSNFRMPASPISYVNAYLQK